tara:strand:+ start:113 stop:298 length:186 start_codon:yes stop_codon:yes gene_type:complete
LGEEAGQVRVGKVLRVAKVDVRDQVVNQDNLGALAARMVVRSSQVVVQPSRVVVLNGQSDQ